MTSWTKQRTVTREQLEASRAAWDAGDFGPEWRPWRHLAAMEAGIIMPPSGTRWDQWDDDEPSERAMVSRAMRETPDALRRALRSPGVRSWAAAVAIVTRHRDTLADDADRRERDWSTIRRGERPSSLGDVIAVIADSVGTAR